MTQPERNDRSGPAPRPDVPGGHPELEEPLEAQEGGPLKKHGDALRHGSGDRHGAGRADGGGRPE